jgi:hypothetical protein
MSFVDPVMEPLIRLLETTQSGKHSTVPAGRTTTKGDCREKRHVYRDLAVVYILGANSSRV